MTPHFSPDVTVDVPVTSDKEFWAAMQQDADVERSKEAGRVRLWDALRQVALPDSRFHWDFSNFIADYVGSADGARRIRALAEWQDSRLMFITPDNNLNAVRELAMEDGKPFVMSTYGIARGFLFLEPARVPPEHRAWAATLDGMERFGRPVGLAEIAGLGLFDLLITGASTISRQGVRSGKGHGYFDLEWAMFSEVGCLAPDPLVVGAGHDCQVTEDELPASEFDTRVDVIVTPTRTLPVTRGQGSRPGRIVWERLQPGMEDRIPPLRELRAWLGAREGRA